MHQPIQYSSSARFFDPIAQEVDVVIVGGGIIGICSAIYLSRMGKKVFVCEKGRVAGEQSSRNWGWIRKLGRDRAEFPIMMEASRLWEALDKEVGGRTGFERQGIAYLATNEDFMEKQVSFVEDARHFGAEIVELDGRQVAEKVNTGKGDGPWVGGIFCPDDARAEPWQAVPALAELARSLGVQIRENCAVRALDIAGGTIVGVHTEHGRIVTEQAVICGGAWSSLLLQRHNILIPQLAVRSTVSRSEPIADIFSGCAADEELAFRRRQDGGYTMSASDAHDFYIGPDAFRHFWKYLPTVKQSLGHTRYHPWAPARHWPDGWSTRRDWGEDEVSPFELCRVLNPEPDRSRIEKVKKRFAARFPEIGEPRISHSWAGMIDAMPDVVPIVDRVADIDGLCIATGMSGHGFGIGPGFGKIVANIVAGKDSGYDLSRFRFSRFSDGSKIEPGPAL